MHPTQMVCTVIVVVAALMVHASSEVLAADDSDASFRGEPFPLIVYGVGLSEGTFAQVKAWGATHVHRYGMGMDIHADQAYFDLAEKFGLKVMSDLGGTRRTKEDGGLEAMRAYVEHFRDHPALGFWYLYDEPSGKITQDKLQLYYDMVASITPDVPVGVAHAWTTGWASYRSTQDVLLNDLYPVTGLPFPEAKLDQLTRFTEAAVRVGPVAVPILQIFNWRVMAAAGEREVRGFPLRQLRYPNDAEMRYMAFASIGMGVRGLAFYSHARMAMDDRSWGDRVLSPLLQEVRAFTAETNAAAMERLGQAAHDLSLTVWQTGEKTLALLASGKGKAQSVCFDTGGLLANGNLEPWGRTRVAEVTLAEGVISMDSMEPWEVMIWEVAGQ